MQGMCHQRSPAFSSKQAVAALSARLQHGQIVRTSELGFSSLFSTHSLRMDVKMEGGRRNVGKAAWCWHALKADSFAPDVLNHMWRSVCGLMLLEADC